MMGSDARDDVMMLGMPNCGSTWLCPILARHSDRSYYDKEFFNPGTNPMHREELSSAFGSERVSTYRHIADEADHDQLDALLDATWRRYTWDFDKEVYAAWKIDWFRKHFTCFVLDRKPGTVFPPLRGHVLIWYEAIYHSLIEAGRLPHLPDRNLMSRAMIAHREGRMRLLNAGLPIIEHDVLTQANEVRIRAELRKVPFRLNIDAAADEILATRISRPKTWRDIQ